MADEREVLELSEKYADTAGFRVNPDKRISDMIIKGLVRNEAKYGSRYCPCRIVTGDKEKDKKIICPCVYHKEEIKDMGHCHCQLFLSRG